MITTLLFTIIATHVYEVVPSVDVVNKSWCFIEFRIRASDHRREWTKLRLWPGEGDSISLTSDGPFDIQIWMYAGEKRWIAHCRNRLPLKTWLDSSGKYRQLYREPFRQWSVTSVNDGPNAHYEYKERFQQTLVFFADGDHFSWPVESTNFRLLESRSEGAEKGGGIGRFPLLCTFRGGPDTSKLNVAGSKRDRPIDSGRNFMARIHRRSELMPSVLSRRESFRSALAAVLTPLFAWLWPARSIPQQAVADGARPPLTTTYRYDDQGRLLSVTTALDPDDMISWTF